MKREHLELAVILARHGPLKKTPPCRVTDIVRGLAREATGQARLSTGLCNGDVSQDFYDECAEARRKRLEQLLAGTGLRARPGGDPRGYTLKLFSTTKKPLPHNSWGGAEEGWGVE